MQTINNKVNIYAETVKLHDALKSKKMHIGDHNPNNNTVFVKW